MNKRKIEEEVFQQNKFEKLNNIADSEDDDDDSVDENNYDVMQEQDIEGQEEGVVGQDGEIRITPFNMQEELEEGHFDKEGMYHWKKEKDVQDNWLENIDWCKIKDMSKEKKNTDENEEDNVEFNVIAAYKEILSMMEPKETISKSLRRLGGNKRLTTAERWKLKKAGLSTDEGSSSKVTRLTELANQILTANGNMDVYQETHEQISQIISKSEKKGQPSTSLASDLDMYAEDFDLKEKEKLESTIQSGKVEPEESEELLTGESLQWEYKFSLESNEVFGPYSTEQMQKWKVEDKFKEPIWVRKCNSNSDFHSFIRVDFELYL
ncbi:CD2 antigen cytoplasmic tail-binding protein 2 homolog [Aphis gossypii]|uniref:CD2 antigen cytoplasmic tail-binding protein 2 homolog n=1 Tax=Aphis gossypii TaxID=80765 RepID=UPI002158E534|nr:CD2 antigen cytoplasmic tail-binding protein 2 homolog [Aphis gossypii]XP_050059060.1 CD2 antigen cytoplasmic tail-binding protein 2 homolog [Aphis gossypii]